jgi:transcriptional regulator with XRE-family HTH domain
MIQSMTSPKTFGRRLRELREAAGYSRRELEDLTEVSQRHIQYLEDDEKQPGRETLDALAKVLGPEIIQAAFPDLVLLRSKRSANPGEVNLTEQVIAEALTAGQSLARALG